MEAIPIPDQSVETCARVYASQTIARHGTGSKLITDQGRIFMSKFFEETCKILGIQHVHTSSLHPEANGKIERRNRTMYEGMSHYVNAANNNW
jgi:transposase InsO family protein